jgi:outer membrane lipoprotein SlyB
VVESVRAVKQQGQGTGVGAVAGGVTGGVVGHQFGKGSGNTAMTVLGAVGGAFAGNAIEKNVRATTVYETQVRMADGNLRSFREATALAIGSHVKVEGTHLKIQAAAAQD